MSTLPDTGPRTARDTQPKRRGRPGYDLESLLEIAAKAFYERGYDGTSMDNLARRLGIAKSAIYHHVRGKEELLERCVGRALDGLFAVADEAEQLDSQAIDKLEHVVRGSVRVLSEQMPFVTVLLRVRGNNKVERKAIARRKEFDHLVANLVEQAETDGDIRPDVDPDTTAKLLFGMINSLIDWYKPRRKSDFTEMADALVKVAFDGIRISQ